MCLQEVQVDNLSMKNLTEMLHDSNFSALFQYLIKEKKTVDDEIEIDFKAVYFCARTSHIDVPDYDKVSFKTKIKIN